MTDLNFNSWGLSYISVLNTIVVLNLGATRQR